MTEFDVAKAVAVSIGRHPGAFALGCVEADDPKMNFVDPDKEIAYEAGRMFAIGNKDEP